MSSGAPSFAPGVWREGWTFSFRSRPTIGFAEHDTESPCRQNAQFPGAASLRVSPRSCAKRARGPVESQRFRRPLLSPSENIRRAGPSQIGARDLLLIFATVKASPNMTPNRVVGKTPDSRVPHPFAQFTKLREECVATSDSWPRISASILHLSSRSPINHLVCPQNVSGVEPHSHQAGAILPGFARLSPGRGERK
jgi:hypothetical protein